MAIIPIQTSPFTAAEIAFLISLAGGGGLEAPTSGTVDGVNFVFTFLNLPLFVVTDGFVRFEGVNYSVTGSGPYTVTLDPLIAPTEYIRSVFLLTSGSSTNPGYQSPLSGSLNQGTFVFTTSPNAIVVDGVPKQKTQLDGTVNWTGTTTITLSVWPTFDIFAIA